MASRSILERTTGPRIALVAVIAFTLFVACARTGSDDHADTDTGLEAAASTRSESPSLHPEFAIEERALLALVESAPAPTIDAVRENPVGFLDRIDAVLDLPYDQTVLVDKEHRLPQGYAPGELVDLDTLSDELVLSRPGHRLTPATTEALILMSRAARAEGITLVVSSTYRSYEYQRDLFGRWVAELGEEQASLVSARPGTSQHQLGTTVDFGCICAEFAQQPAGEWLAENAARFGFSLSYPEGLTDITGYSYEPWHFRYTGSAAVDLEHEYFVGVQQYMLEFLDDHRPVLAAARVAAHTE